MGFSSSVFTFKFMFMVKFMQRARPVSPGGRCRTVDVRTVDACLLKDKTGGVLFKEPNGQPKVPLVKSVHSAPSFILLASS